MASGNKLNAVMGLSTHSRFHRLGLTLQLANPRLRDNRGLSPACVPSSSVNLTAHLTCDLTSFPSSSVCDWLSRSRVTAFRSH